MHLLIARVVWYDNTTSEGARVEKSYSEGGRGGAYSFVVCLSYMTIDHAPLSRRSNVPTPNRDTSNIRAFLTLFPRIT